MNVTAAVNFYTLVISFTLFSKKRHFGNKFDRRLHSWNTITFIASLAQRSKGKQRIVEESAAKNACYPAGGASSASQIP